ncbi:phage recombination protein Bet [Peptoniphilus harei]|uniref:phage recombination protein Bet n=1 Tax=Peptoniphilus harei TaxID=54005 RepID=UPI00254CF01E|nr:phage recombination protein Bet [Peptoniphilus harei]MDK7354935.1 phage recombination protein Bet [Peptoniphilus harei]MDK7370663.1 phage recombination protein Bet [Peptoniphilus harei]
MNNELMVKYEAGGQEIQLSQSDVKNFLVTGDADKVTDKEFKLFLELCKAQKLNPFLREAYLIKFGNDANIITGKDVFLKRARANESFRGFKAGIIVQSERGIEKREGTFYLKGQENLVGGWASIYIKDWDVPFDHTVALSEFNKGTATWKNMPAIMIRKVALVQALREAFPDDLSQLYAAEEMGTDPAIEDSIVLENKDEFFIGNDERKKIFELADGKVEVVKAVLSKYMYGSTRNIKKSDFDGICEDIIKLISISKTEKVENIEDAEVVEEVEEEEDFLKGTPFEK